MSETALAYKNLADSAVLSASSSAPLMTSARLQEPHVGRKWRGVSGTTEHVTVDMLTSQSADTVAIMGLNLTAGGTAQLRISNSDPTGVAGEIYNSGSLAEKVDSNYGYLIFLLSTAVSGRYYRIDMADASLSYIEAGRLFIGLRHEFEVSYSPGNSRQYVDLSRKEKSRGGQVYVDPGPRFRAWEVAFEWLTEAERNGAVEEIDRDIGERNDVLLLSDTTSSNLGRDSIWGMLTNNQGIIERSEVNTFRKAYRIEERL